MGTRVRVRGEVSRPTRAGSGHIYLNLKDDQAVLDACARVTGPTVHFVDEVFDHGAIVAQWPVPVHPADTAATLAARVLRAEHALYPRVVHAVAAGAVSLGDGRVRWAGTSAVDDGAFELATPAERASVDPAGHPGDHSADSEDVIATLRSLYPNL